MRLSADSSSISCCVCVTGVKTTVHDTALRAQTCSRVCQQLLVFVQGLVFGHVLSYLTRCTDAAENHTQNRASVVDNVVNDWLLVQKHGNYVKKESEGSTTSGEDLEGSRDERDPDMECNQDDELLKVTFDFRAGIHGAAGCRQSFVQRPTSSTPVVVPLFSHDNFDALAGQHDAISSPSSSQLQASVSVSSPVNKMCSAEPLSMVGEKNTAEDLPLMEGHSSEHLLLTGEKITTEQSSIMEGICNTQDSLAKNRFTAELSSLAERVRKKKHLIVKEPPDVCWTRKMNQKKGSCNTNRHRQQVQCDQCGKSFIKSHLYVHKRAKHRDSVSAETNIQFSCNECNKSYEKKSQLNKHLTMQHCSDANVTKSCTLCHKTFSSQIGVSVHMRQAHQVASPKQCDLCQKTFESCKELSRHKLHDHKLRVHVCHLCGKRFAYSHALKSHLDAHAGVKKHFCEVCGEGFVRMTSLCGHRASAHSKKDAVFSCMLCDSSFNTKSLLNKHLFECHLTGPYAIKDYRRQLATTKDPNCHMCKAATEKCTSCPLHDTGDTLRFVCSHCGKKFSRSHYLKAHEKQHQVARFSCDICCKRFTYKCNLKAHMSTHSNNKPYQCSVCPKTFRLKFLLEDHQRLHNQDSLFKCYVCGRGLTRIPNLKRHIRVMHPEVNYEQQFSNMHQLSD